MILRRELVVLHEIRDDLVEVGVDALVNAEAKPQLHFEHEVGAKVVDHVLIGVGLVRHVDVEEVVCPGSLRALVQDGVEDVAIKFVRRGVVGQKDQVVCRVGKVIIMRECLELVEILRHGQIDGLCALYGGPTSPDVHDSEDERCHEHREPAAMEELGQAREEEHELDSTEGRREHHRKG